MKSRVHFWTNKSCSFNGSPKNSLTTPDLESILAPNTPGLGGFSQSQNRTTCRRTGGSSMAGLGTFGLWLLTSMTDLKSIRALPTLKHLTRHQHCARRINWLCGDQYERCDQKRKRENISIMLRKPLRKWINAWINGSWSLDTALFLSAHHLLPF